METTKKTQVVGIKNAGIVIICCFIIAVCIYHFLLGNPSNFMNNDPNNHPLPGNFLGTIYKGGIIVPVIQTLLLTVLALSIERYFALVPLSEKVPWLNSLLTSKLPWLPVISKKHRKFVTNNVVLLPML